MTQIRHIIHSFSFFYLLRKIDSLEKQNEIDIYYIHFLTNAFQLIDFLRVTRKRVFVHCYGFDITWNLKRYQYPDIDYFNCKFESFVIFKSKTI